jgi:hypothetical protein
MAPLCAATEPSFSKRDLAPAASAICDSFLSQWAACAVCEPEEQSQDTKLHGRSFSRSAALQPTSYCCMQFDDEIKSINLRWAQTSPCDEWLNHIGATIRTADVEQYVQIPRSLLLSKFDIRKAQVR